MVPRIAQRGHSFKGAGQYYLHDKQAQTKERVVWTHTLNLPTKDPDKAFKWMAHTALNANRLKQQANIPSTGRKSKAGEVYSFSIAWHPEQKPDKDTLLNSALETLGLLRLEEHEAVIVAHQDTAHPHVHVICNLVHPENGKTAVPSYDRLTLSQWAENVERNDGEILCEQRVINNKKRREQGLDNKLKLVKHKEPKLSIADTINALYQQSGTGRAFQEALEEKGYTLAKGDRRAYVLVDEAGKIYSLSRQLKGQRAKDLSERFKGLQALPDAKDIAFERQHFDRDKYEAESQKKIVDAAIKENLKPTEMSNSKKPSNKELSGPKEQQEYDDNHLVKLDALREWEQKADRQRNVLEKQQEVQYGRKKLLKEIKVNEEMLSNPGFFDKINPYREKPLRTHIENLKKNLANIDQRIAEQNAALEQKLQKENPVNIKNLEKMDFYPEQKIKSSRDQSGNEKERGRELDR